MAAANTTIPQSAEDIAPSWVQQVLQGDLPGVIITDVDGKGSIGEGEGFSSDIVAFDATGSWNGVSWRHSLVAKLTDFARLAATVRKENQVRAKEGQIKAEAIEVEFYSTMVPELLSAHAQSAQAKVKSKGNDGDRSPFADPSFLPKCYFAATDPTSKVSVRVMENLKSQGFSIKANRQSLNREEMMLTVGALAQLHGLSHRLELLSGSSLSEKFDRIFAEPVFKLDTAIMGYQIGIKTFAAAFPGQADLVDRLGKINVQSVLFDAMEKSQRMKVLNHGDLWINNIMIKYEGEVPTEVKLVDWQVIQYLPPTCDLAFLFLCAASWDAFHNHRDGILAHYNQELQKALGPSESPRLQSYTLDELKADFKADCLHALVTRVIRLFAVRPEAELLQKVQELNSWGVI